MSRFGKDINFYTAYRDSQRAKKPSAQWLAGVIPLAVVLIAVILVAVSIRFGNLQKSAVLDGLNRQIQQMNTEYEEVQTLMTQSDSLSVLAGELQTDRNMAAALPKLNENIFRQINACAASIFTISVYRYDERTRMLEIDASAPSVNDMPELVEALRDTALFESVQYVGYTSDTDGVYYCTVGCLLAEEAEADE